MIWITVWNGILKDLWLGCLIQSFAQNFALQNLISFLRDLDKNWTILKALGTLPMQSTELSIQEMERCKLETDIVGFEIGKTANTDRIWLVIINRIVCEAIKGTTINDDNLNDPRFDALWEKASELDFCFFIHPWDMQRGGCHEAFWSPWLTGNGELSSRLYIGIFEALRLANHGKECLKELLMQPYVWYLVVFWSDFRRFDFV